MHIVDDEQRSDRHATPMRPPGSGLEGASASLALLDDVHRHRLRRAALHLPLPSQERGPFQFSDRLLDHHVRTAYSQVADPVCCGERSAHGYGGWLYRECGIAEPDN